MNKFNFKNRTAIITGGAQGFGLDIAKKYLEFVEQQKDKETMVLQLLSCLQVK